MFGDISAWFYQTLAGINTDPVQRPAFKRTFIRPRPVGDLKWVAAEHESPYGTVASRWKLEGGVLSLDVTVPANTTGIVCVPARDQQAVREGDRPASQSTSVKFLEMQDGAAVFETPSGKYRFTVDVTPERQ